MDAVEALPLGFRVRGGARIWLVQEVSDPLLGGVRYVGGWGDVLVLGRVLLGGVVSDSLPLQKLVEPGTF